jgi:predicted  nucleic acid-binding Zn-ribbon protein
MIDPCSELKSKLTEIEARLKEMSTFSDILHEQEKLTRQSYLTEDQRMSIRVELKFKRDVRQQLRQERENIIDEIEDIYSGWQESHDERYQLPY